MAKIPASLIDIAETLGLPIVLQLVEHFGGTEQQFPKKPTDDHPVVRVLGKDNGRALCDFLAGDHIYIPHMRMRKSIRLDVLALQEQGKQREEIARLLGVSQRHVRRMANKAVNPDQTDMFSGLDRT